VAAVIHLHQQMRAAGLNVETGHKLHES
jgi:hypothetical protein